MWESVIVLCCTLICVHSSIAIILMGKRELVASLNLSSWCAHAPVNGRPVFPGTFLGHFWCFLCCFFVLFFILSKFPNSHSLV